MTPSTTTPAATLAAYNAYYCCTACYEPGYSVEGGYYCIWSLAPPAAGFGFYCEGAPPYISKEVGVGYCYGGKSLEVGAEPVSES